MKIKLVIGDDDPWHLSWKPIALFVLGLVAFGTGAARLVLTGAGAIEILLLVVGIALWGVAFWAAVRERSDFDGAIAAKEQQDEEHA